MVELSCSVSKVKVMKSLEKINSKEGLRSMFAIEAGQQGCLPCGRGIVYQDNIKDHYGEPPDQGQLGKLNMWPMP